MASNYSSASETDIDSGVQEMEGFISMYCGDPEFLSCVDMKKVACDDVFKTSLTKCSLEMATLKDIVEKETSPFEANENREKAKRDAGKCTIQGLNSVVKEDLLASCISSSTQRLMDKLEKSTTRRRKSDEMRQAKLRNIPQDFEILSC